MNILERRNTLYCFSPGVMLATFVIEFALALFVFVRYRITRFGKVASGTLILLGTFQLAEYQICGGHNKVFWSRLGFIAITLLPIAGLYLVSLVIRKPYFLKLGYATAAVFIIYFAFVPKSISGAACGGNYVIFNASNDFYRLYGFYYLGFLLLGVWESLEKMASLGPHSNTRPVLQWLIIGYLSFMGPMGLVYITYPEARNAVASIMCGFAVLLALTLAFKIVPDYNRIHRINAG